MSLPQLWLGGAIAVVLLGAAELPRPLSDYSLHDTYYVIAHAHYVFNLAGAFVFFAVVYWAFDRVFRVSYSRFLGLAHFATTLAGVLSMSLPLLAAPGLSVSRQATIEAFDRLKTMNSIGYWLILAGLVLFAVVVIDAIRRRLAARPATR